MIAAVASEPDDSTDAHEYLHMLWLPGEVREVRIPKYNEWGQTAAGWFDDPDAEPLFGPDYRLGFLSAQMLRSVRVIVDIGMHLGYRIPTGTTLTDGTAFHGGEVWTPDLAYEFAVSETGQGETFLASEIDRYLGWPAQAISYKIGEREWLAARAETEQRLGSAFDLRAFHTFALGLGPLGLHQLRSELLAFGG